MKKIQFSKLTFDKKEEEAAIKCMRSGWVVLGPKTEEFEEKFAKYVGSKYAVFVNSGTAALDLSLRAVNYGPVIKIPSFTFVSDAEILYHQHQAIDFVDVDENTLCVEKRTKDCLPTNFAGNLAGAKGRVIDSCHRIEKNDVKKRPDSLWCYSFYATKNMSTVQGGMIALNNEKRYKWLKMARDHGITKGTKQRYQGKNPFYDIKFPGWRVKSDDVAASIGIEQLKKLPKITKERNRVVARYNKNLGLNRVGNHLYYIFVVKRAKFIEEMYDKGIQCSVHFRPIHTLSAYKCRDVNLPVTEKAYNHIVSIPLFPQLTDKEVDYISKQVLISNKLIK